MTITTNYLAILFYLCVLFIIFYLCYYLFVLLFLCKQLSFWLLVCSLNSCVSSLVCCSKTFFCYKLMQRFMITSTVESMYHTLSAKYLFSGLLDARYFIGILFHFMKHSVAVIVIQTCHSQVCGSVLLIKYSLRVEFAVSWGTEHCPEFSFWNLNVAVCGFCALRLFFYSRSITITALIGVSTYKGASKSCRWDNHGGLEAELLVHGGSDAKPPNARHFFILDSVCSCNFAHTRSAYAEKSVGLLPVAVLGFTFWGPVGWP